MRAYRERLARAWRSVEDTAIEAVVQVLSDTRSSRQRVWLIGNGGSASTADHLATDLLRCADLNGNLVPVTSLCSNLGIVTATANDLGYKHIFTRQLQMLASNSDILISLSASGTSPNIVDAMEWAQAHSLRTVALTGFEGGPARQLADISIHVESAVGDYGVVEDVHLSICHMVVESLRPDLKTASN